MTMKQEWPRAQFTVLADWLASKEEAVRRPVAEAAHDALGFALDQVYEAKKLKVVAHGASPPPFVPVRAEAAFVLRDCGLQHTVATGLSAAECPPMPPIDWNQVVAIILSIIQYFWK